MAQLGKLIENLPLMNKPSKLKIGRELNRGAYGVVYEGTLAGQQVAVKGVHESHLKAKGGEIASRRFCDECERLKKLEHPHVIKFLGAFKDAKLGPILVMERMKENLRCFLEKNKDKLTIQEQIRISLEIAQGVAFLHQLTPPMVHRDLNDKNVMFTFDGVVKIGDFGQTTFMTEFCLTTTAPGMVSFMAPEALRSGNAEYDENLDVFSLGVLMLSIGTQHPPSSDLTGICVTPEVQRRAKDLERMNDCHSLKPFILHCLRDDPEQRPKATQLVNVLPRLKENMVQTMLAAEQEFRKMEAEVASRDAKIRELEERCELLEAKATTYKEDFEQERSDREMAKGKFEAERQEFKLHIAELNEKFVAYEEGLTAETSEALNSHSRQATKEKKQTDHLADVNHEHSSDDLELKEQPAAMATKQKGKSKEKRKKMSRDNSKVDLNRYPLKSDFDTIVRNKDEEILKQIKQIQQMNQDIATIENLLAKKCSMIRQLRETYCIPHQCICMQDDPSWEHSVKENGATPIEHSTVLPKHASSATAVEKQHQQDQNEVQTSLLEEDGEKDSAELTENLPEIGQWDMEREIESELTTRAATVRSEKATSHVCSMQD